jgi:hypothetical protein
MLEVCRNYSSLFVSPPSTSLSYLCKYSFPSFLVHIYFSCLARVLDWDIRMINCCFPRSSSCPLLWLGSHRGKQMCRSLNIATHSLSFEKKGCAFYCLQKSSSTWKGAPRYYNHGIIAVTPTIRKWSINDNITNLFIRRCKSKRLPWHRNHPHQILLATTEVVVVKQAQVRLLLLLISKKRMEVEPMHPSMYSVGYPSHLRRR